MHTDSLLRFGRLPVVRRMLALATVTGMATAIAGVCPGVASASVAAHGQLRAGAHAAPGSQMTLAQAPAGLRAAMHKTLGIHAGPAAWSSQAELTASDGGTDNYFGFSVAISGNTAVVGAYVKSSYKGAAYVFVRSGTTWSQQAELHPSTPKSNEQFGYSVAISVNTAVVGAPGTKSDTGAAYVFTRSGTTWSQKKKLTANNGVSNDFFGDSVAMAGSAKAGFTVLVGADHGNSTTGAAYVYTGSGATWSQQAELIASGAAFFDGVGASVAISGSTAIVGATGTNNGAGAAYLFKRSGTTWSQLAELTDPAATSLDDFGQSVAISGSTVVVGAPGTSSNTGAAYVYTGSGSTWPLQATLTDPSVTPGDQFGWSAALSGSTAVVGSPQEYSTSVGEAYVYKHSAAGWSLTSILTSGSTPRVGEFGLSVTLSGTTAVAGADFTNSATGAAFVFVNA